MGQSDPKGESQANDSDVITIKGDHNWLLLFSSSSLVVGFCT